MGMGIPLQAVNAMVRTSTKRVRMWFIVVLILVNKGCVNGLGVAPLAVPVLLLCLSIFWLSEQKS
jgi:hypothetical protein